MATKKSQLRAVAPDEKPERKRNPSVIEAAESGDHRQLLIAMRERIARTVNNPDCPPRDLAALTRRLQDIAKEIEILDLRAKEEAAQDGGTSADEQFDASAI